MQAHNHSAISERKPVWLPLHHRVPPFPSLQRKGLETPWSETLIMDAMLFISAYYTILKRQTTEEKRDLLAAELLHVEDATRLGAVRVRRILRDLLQ